MVFWWHTQPDSMDPDAVLVKAVPVSRETKDFLYVDEEQVWNGKRVTRQRRVSKSGGSWHGAYFQKKSEALSALQEREAKRMERLRKESEVSGKRLIRITAALAQARKDETAASIPDPNGD